MLVKITKRLQIGERILEPGYEIDTSKMPAFNEKQVSDWLETGFAEALSGHKPTKKNQSTAKDSDTDAVLGG